MCSGEAGVPCEPSVQVDRECHPRCLPHLELPGRLPLSTNQMALYQSLSGSTRETPKPSQCLHSRAPGL